MDNFFIRQKTGHKYFKYFTGILLQHYHADGNIMYNKAKKSNFYHTIFMLVAILLFFYLFNTENTLYRIKLDESWKK
ncbi:hypothetical protein BpHYR1_040209 [Brachionus plicatilis]|uniref:Uncharacterized protein n=1 Tax=Brachionus plicatilis TaxID=10195 RepID=A0A3M7PXT4_BRAPC|nr:hypothetical protein BpHYR1_040209 [Brachionus plicatilis]